MTGAPTAEAGLYGGVALTGVPDLEPDACKGTLDVLGEARGTDLCRLPLSAECGVIGGRDGPSTCEDCMLEKEGRSLTGVAAGGCQAVGGTDGRQGVDDAAVSAACC